MELFIKTALCGITGILMLQTIKKKNPETFLLLVLAVTIGMLSAVLPVIRSVFSFIDGLCDTTGLSPAILTPVIKILGISIITKIGHEVCIDCEAKAVGACIELAGAVCAVYVALPLLSATLKLITSFV